MAKTPSAKIDEDFRGRIRELEKENRSLRRRLKTLERNRQIWEYFSLDSDENVPREEDQYQVQPTCPSCKQPIVLLDLGLKKLWTCTSCGFRKIENGQS